MRAHSIRERSSPRLLPREEDDPGSLADKRLQVNLRVTNMAIGKSTQSSCCLKTTVLMFVGLCLVGIWMFTSSNITPEDLSYLLPKSEATDKFVDKTKEGSPSDRKGSIMNTSNDTSETDTSIVGNGKGGGETLQEANNDGEVVMSEDNMKETQNKDEKQETEEKTKNDEKSDVYESEKEKHKIFPSRDQSELLKETNSQNGAWSTQAVESETEEAQASSSKGQIISYTWKLCNTSAGPDFIPCLDNQAVIKKLRSTKHYEHRERHCPKQAPTCLVPLPDVYKQPIKWPRSRDKIWYNNVPHTKLVEYKGHQNWVKVSGDYLIFPGGGTQFKRGALHYIDFVEESLPDLAWGRTSRVVLDVGCGVASFGGYLFEKDVLTMSFAPKDEHEAQVQFALERGIPAISAVMGTKRLPFPSKVFDVVHCARCRVPWHIEGGMLLLELNRLLRPGGYFVWSATPVYQNLPEDVGIWKAMSALTKSMCWEMVAKRKDRLNNIGVAIFRKPTTNKCYEERAKENPPLCQESDDPDAAWNIPLQACMHKLPVDSSSRGVLWPEEWPLRLEKTPYWLNSSQIGVYGRPAPQDFAADYEHWKHVVSKSYINGMGVDWSTVRNVMDMRSIYGGFAAALQDMKKVWVMNIVPIDSPDTLPIIYERGLFGLYHDWCESFSTYPRTYDLLHADHLFSKLKKRCDLMPVIVEVDRILRPRGNLIVRDNVGTISEIGNLAKSLHWEIHLTYSKGSEGLLYVQKSMWRPKAVESSTL
ncbi:putative methyltransferase PMT26 [Canna indica]|uniref:Methyltransferase PMT26 n=1 Tax=Canna indica TaxID=4628 RepID=A0AAQ3K941_9LILI|nr:putative methyltransferase PMT26 [Canna indica]